MLNPAKENDLKHKINSFALAGCNSFLYIYRFILVVVSSLELAVFFLEATRFFVPFDEK